MSCTPQPQLLPLSFSIQFNSIELTMFLSLPLPPSPRAPPSASALGTAGEGTPKSTRAQKTKASCTHRPRLLLLFFFQLHLIQLTCLFMNESKRFVPRKKNRFGRTLGGNNQKTPQFLEATVSSPVDFLVNNGILENISQLKRRVRDDASSKIAKTAEIAGLKGWVTELESCLAQNDLDLSNIVSKHFLEISLKIIQLSY